MSPNQVEIIRFHPDRHQHLIPSLIGCYQEVFAGHPWHELFRCSNPKCKAHWGYVHAADLVQKQFRHHGQLVQEHWPSQVVADEIKARSTPGSSFWLALTGKRVVGFCWGYLTPPEALETELGILFAGELRSTFGHNDNESIAFQNELGMLPEYRGQKKAKEMVRLRLKDFLARGLRMGVVRTREKPEPSVTFSWFTSIGYRIVARYPEKNGQQDGRVILARPLNDELVQLLS